MHCDGTSPFELTCLMHFFAQHSDICHEHLVIAAHATLPQPPQTCAFAPPSCMQVRGICVAELGIITGSRDKTVRVWAEGSTPSEYTCVSTLAGHTDFVVPVAYIPVQGSIVAASTSITDAMDTDSGVDNTDDAGGAGTAPSGRGGLSAGGLVVSGSRDKSVRLWDAGSASCVTALTGHEQQVACLAVGPDGEVYSGALDK